MIAKVRTFLSIFAVYISVCGLAGFSLFLIEESSQQLVFSSWLSSDNQDWSTMNASANMIEDCTKLMRTVNSCVGWINPLTYISYNEYAKSSDQYVKAMRSKILAHAPHLFIGQRVSFELSATNWEHTEQGWQARAGKITVLSSDQLPLHTLVSGVLSSDLLLDIR